MSCIIHHKFETAYKAWWKMCLKNTHAQFIYSLIKQLLGAWEDLKLCSCLSRLFLPQLLRFDLSVEVLFRPFALVLMWGAAVCQNSDPSVSFSRSGQCCRRQIWLVGQMVIKDCVRVAKNLLRFQSALRWLEMAGWHTLDAVSTQRSPPRRLRAFQ